MPGKRLHPQFRLQDKEQVWNPREPNTTWLYETPLHCQTQNVNVANSIMFSALWNSNPLFRQLSSGFMLDWDMLIAESWLCRHKHTCRQIQGPHFPRLNAHKQWALSNCWALDLSRFTVEFLWWIPLNSSTLRPWREDKSTLSTDTQVHVAMCMQKVDKMPNLSTAKENDHLNIHPDYFKRWKCAIVTLRNHF